MNKVFVAALSASVLLSAAAAVAQGLPASTEPQNYGTGWSARQNARLSQGVTGTASQANASQADDHKLADQNLNRTVKHTP